MTLFLLNDNYHYELENVARMFFWQLTVQADTPAQLPEEYLVAHAEQSADGIALSVRCCAEGKAQQLQDMLPADSALQQVEHRLAVLLFEALSAITGKRPPFGVMTGIRPAKYTAKLINEGMSGDEAQQWLQTHALLAPDKARLCRMTAESGIRLSERIRKDGFSLYVSIPFCPSRCSYCSFVSKSVERDRALVQPYVDALCKEIAHTADITKDLGLTLQTVYIGGGTPSVLTAEQLQQLTDCIAAVYPLPSEG
ncbi:MAG: coproporphyrinogen dehydrogenase HemZ, partial [Oscillospiraceae bacterium]|nr:coproporphyrinogen dehydrogenase HemZ [Oscillospiraceae bacterium]